MTSIGSPNTLRILLLFTIADLLGSTSRYLEVMTQIAETCVKYEEALCEKEYPLCEDIPEWRRIHSSGLGGWDVSSDKTTVTAHLRTRPNGMDGEWSDIQEPIDLSVLRLILVCLLYANMLLVGRTWIGKIPRTSSHTTSQVRLLS